MGLFAIVSVSTFSYTSSRPDISRHRHHSAALLQLRALHRRDCAKVIRIHICSYCPDTACSIELTRSHLRSALASQHLRGINVDIIMVDDGSSDTSLSLLRSIASNISYSNYSVIHLSPNGGAAAARNAGVAAATGKVIAFAESDDWYLRDSTSQGDYLWENCPKVRCRIQPLVCIDALLFRRKSSSFELLNNGS